MGSEFEVYCYAATITIHKQQIGVAHTKCVFFLNLFYKNIMNCHHAKYHQSFFWVFLHTDSGHGRSSLVKHSHRLGQQQLGFGHDCEDAQDVKGITHRVTPAGRERERKREKKMTS